jgi:SAM-dependent methyltransferase
MVFDGPVPFTVDQPVKMGLMTVACILELRGTVAEVHETPSVSGESSGRCWTRLAVKFDPIAALERKVFASLLDAVRDRLRGGNLAALLIVEDAADLLLQIGYLSANRRSYEPFPFFSHGSQEREDLVTADHMSDMDSIEREFWEHYLDHFDFIVNVPDYWQLLDRIRRLIGGESGEMLILDAGCGHANLGQFLLIDQAYRQTGSYNPEMQPSCYVGVDFISSALREAKRQLGERALELNIRRPYLNGPSSLKSSLFCADLNHSLPFEDNQFDRIVCNLALAYVRKPLGALQEMMRVLAPAGRLVLSILKPVSDPLQVYRDILSCLEQAEDRLSVQWMLNNWAWIHLMEYQAGKRISDWPEFERLLSMAGAFNVRMYPAFHDRVMLVIAEKPVG